MKKMNSLNTTRKSTASVQNNSESVNDISLSDSKSNSPNARRQTQKFSERIAAKGGAPPGFLNKKNVPPLDALSGSIMSERPLFGENLNFT